MPEFDCANAQAHIHAHVHAHAQFDDDAGRWPCEQMKKDGTKCTKVFAAKRNLMRHIRKCHEIFHGDKH